MGVKVANNASSTLAANIGTGDTGFSVAAGTGALFPSLGGSDYFYATLVDASGNREIIKVTARSTDALTVARAQDGTTAKSFSAGDTIELRICRAMLEDFLAETTAAANAVAAYAAGNIGQFQYVGTTQCKFMPYKGNYMPLKNGSTWELHEIPAAGISFSNGSLSADTLYYAYVYLSGGVPTAEFSTTGYATDADNGTPIKSGDATRTLVGLVYTDGSSQFVDSLQYRYVASWANRQPRALSVNPGSGTYTTTSASLVELDTAFNVNFVAFADAHYEAEMSLTLDGNSSSSVSAEVYEDGGSVANANAVTTQGSGTKINLCANWGSNMTASAKRSLQGYGAISSGTLTVYADQSQIAGWVY